MQLNAICNYFVRYLCDLLIAHIGVNAINLHLFKGIAHAQMNMLLRMTILNATYFLIKLFLSLGNKSWHVALNNIKE